METKELEEVIKLWKKEAYTSASFKFSCGGDSMGDTEWYFYNKRGIVKRPNEDVKNYLNEEVYERVEFYKESDEEYLGEYGYVDVILNDEEIDFEFTKESTSEYIEEYGGEVELELTEVEASFVRDNIRNFNGRDDENNVNYNVNRDFILTAKQDKMVGAIAKRIRKMASDFHPEDEDTENLPVESFTFQAEVSNMSGNIITINVIKRFRW